ncbi:MAG TPA: hypothetical protein VLA75_07900 [Thermoanaerobaculia bacterium]|nr:hypothetical protein [Thermoanaerobaculia bacterium]
MSQLAEGKLGAILAIGHETSLRGSGRSLADLLAATRYRELRSDLSVERLALEIELHSRLVDEWERYSEDKRTSGGWWLLRKGTMWEVGRFVEGDPANVEAETFGSAWIATATFILRELDFWADVAPEGHR